MLAKVKGLVPEKKWHTDPQSDPEPARIRSQGKRERGHREDTKQDTYPAIK
jgi:hypothetical protein